MSEWISVDERLPEEDAAVLVWLGEDDGSYFEVAWQHNSFWFNGYDLDCEPTHWQPLPPPPEQTA